MENNKLHRHTLCSYNKGRGVETHKVSTSGDVTW